MARVLRDRPGILAAVTSDAEDRVHTERGFATRLDRLIDLHEERSLLRPDVDHEATIGVDAAVALQPTDFGEAHGDRHARRNVEHPHLGGHIVVVADPDRVDRLAQSLWSGVDP